MIDSLAVTLMPTLAAEAAHGGETSSVFAGTIAQSIAAAIVFLVLVALLYKKAWGPILRGLQDREQRIKEDLERADRSSHEADRKLAEYKKQLADAQVEAQKVIEQARKDADRIAAQLKDDAQTQITAMRDRAGRDITAAKEQAIADLYAQAGTLATHVAGRILQREIRPEDQQQLINESLSQFKSRSN
jgi:F-type H+-transporting ATPase subunit b